MIRYIYTYKGHFTPNPLQLTWAFINNNIEYFNVTGKLYVIR